MFLKCSHEQCGIYVDLTKAQANGWDKCPTCGGELVVSNGAPAAEPSGAEPEPAEPSGQAGGQPQTAAGQAEPGATNDLDARLAKAAEQIAAENGQQVAPQAASEPIKGQPQHADSPTPPPNPGHRQGEDPTVSRGLSVARLCAAEKSKDWSNAKVEREVSDTLKSLGYKSKGGTLLPLDSKAIEQEFPSDPRAKGLHETMVTGYQPSVSASQKMSAFFGKQLSSRDDTLGGVLVDAEAEMIDLLRPNVVMESAGANVFTLPQDNELPMPKRTSDADFGYIGENPTDAEKPAESEPGTGGVKLRGRDLVGFVRVPNQLLERATMSAEQFVRESLANGAALKEDLTFMRGRGGENVPTGLRFWPGINSVTLENDGGDGATPTIVDVRGIKTEVEKNNGTLGAWLMTATVQNKIWLIRDNNNLPIFPATAQQASLDQLLGSPVLISNQIPEDLTKGSGSNLSEIYAGDFGRAAAIGRGPVMEIEATTEGEGTFKNFQTLFRARLVNDFAVLDENVLLYVDGVETQ